MWGLLMFEKTRNVHKEWGVKIKLNTLALIKSNKKMSLSCQEVTS